ncbi:MAG: AAA family ATPase, partial [Phycisphaerales bacterium]
MSEISRVALFGKLSPLAYKAVEGATVFCKLRGNPYVELVHWIHQIMQHDDTDLHRIIRRFELNPSKLAADMTAALDRLPRGATSISDFSPHLEDAIERGWVYGSLKYGAWCVRTGHLMVGIVKTRELRNVLLSMSKEFDAIKPEQLADELDKIIAGSPEESQPDQASGAGAGPGEASGAVAPAAMGKQEALKRYSVDLTERAQKGEIDPIVGRDDEIRQVVDILMRRRQNNPILTGEAGVGKTAVVEGFALRIAAGDVPPQLQNVSLRSLDLGLLQAGAGVKGEFENRLKSVIEEVKSSPTPIIVFIDEAHTLIGAGGAAGQGDAANLLKPALARGELRTIAATTFDEYKKHFEGDPALKRRFQEVRVDEPDEHKAIRMLRAVAEVMEKHHKVRILDEAVSEAVKLGIRYRPERQLPDKAVSLLDTASARVKLSQGATPAALDDVIREIEHLGIEMAALERENSGWGDHSARLKELGERKAESEAKKVELDERLVKERELVAAIQTQLDAT